MIEAIVAWLERLAVERGVMAVERYDEVLPSELRCLDVIEVGAGQWVKVVRLHHGGVATDMLTLHGVGYRLDPRRRYRRRVA